MNCIFLAGLQQAGAEKGHCDLSRTRGQKRSGQLVQEGRTPPMRRGEPHPGQRDLEILLKCRIES